MFCMGCLGKLLREIVDAVLSKMKKVPLEVATFPVGLEEAVQDFESKVWSSIGSENAHIVGIVGMGGSGKTTLAKELYNRKCSSIRRSSFLANVRDAASTSTLHKLQNKLIRDLNIQHRAFDNEDEGKGVLARYLRSMVVLIVLDDVDDVEQMHALLPHKLGQGSFIIITTREKKVLRSCGISSVYDMKLLDPVNAKQLFCRHAFIQPYSLLGFENLAEKSHKFQNLIERFVKACHGLPLALKVVGAMVNGQSEAYWEEQLLHFSNILPKEIVKSLKLSYDALDPEVQQMFLDVACFFIGKQKSFVVIIWHGSGWRGEVGWETLVSKCLVGLDKYDDIHMHDHLRDMGREIARDTSPARIWKDEQISIQGGKTQIRGIVGAPLQPWDFGMYYPLEHYMENFIKRPALCALKLLSVSGNDFSEEFAASRDLVWLRLWDFDGDTLPSWLSLANLRVLELHVVESLEELWQGNVQPPLQLRELIIQLPAGNCFRSLPRSIGRLRHLKRIYFSGNGSEMRELPAEFCYLKSLEELELSGFPLLASLPVDFGKLINLRSLKFVKVQLMELPHSFKYLRALQSLSIVDSKSFMLTSKMIDVLEFMTELQVLSFYDCPLLEELPRLTTQASLTELDLTGSGLRELPDNICQLTNLETLKIGSYNLINLPQSLGALSSLTSLSIGPCPMLNYLPESLGRLANLQTLDICFTPVLELRLGIGSPSGCNLNSLRSLRLMDTLAWRISISDDCCPNLESVTLWCNYYLVEIEILPRKVRKIELCLNNNLREIETLPGTVRDLIVDNCTALESMRAIASLRNLERLEVYRCPHLQVLPRPLYMHSAGHTIIIKDCPKVDLFANTPDEIDTGRTVLRELISIDAMTRRVGI